MEKKEEGKRLTLNVGPLNQPNHNGHVYPREALEKAVDDNAILTDARHPIGRVPTFAEFVKMIAPELDPEKVDEMAAMFERMSSFETACSMRGVGITAGEVKERQRLAQALYERVKDMGGETLLSKAVDSMVTIAPRMSGDRVVSYDVVKARASRPDAEGLTVIDGRRIDDDLPEWLYNAYDPLDPVIHRTKGDYVLDTDVQHAYLTPIAPLDLSQHRSLLGGVRSDFHIGGFEGDTMTHPKNRRLTLGTVFRHHHPTVSGDITVNGGKKKELVQNAKRTMTYPRPKSKFGR